MELYPYKKDDYPIIEDMYMVEDKHSGAIVPCGFTIENGKLYLPKGSPISKIVRLTKATVNKIDDSDPSSNMHRQFYAAYDPRDEIQEQSIKFLRESESQAALNLATGLGKTYSVAAASTLMRERTLIITPNETLKKQWIKTYRTMFDYRESDLFNISGSNSIQLILDNLIDPCDVYFVNHSTLRNYLTATNGYMLHQFFKKLNIGIKVYDEAHMEFGNILLMDFFSNTKHTWYLTATFDRSSKEESKCFKQAFSSVPAYGSNESKEVVQKHVIYHVVKINSHISRKNMGRVMGYPGLTAASYGRYAFLMDPTESAYVTIKMLINKVKKLDGKILIFVPLIDAVDKVAKQLKDDFPDKTIGIFHSKVSKDEKDEAEKRDIIVSTIKSLGTGKDIKGLRSIICAEPIASKVVAEQMIGRLRPYAPDKDTYFFDIIDVAIPALNWWFNARYKRIMTLVKNTVYLDMDH